MKANMWDREDIPKISRALPICMAPTDGIARFGVRQMTYTSRWVSNQATLLIADLLRDFPSVTVA
eukprot:4588545-Pleurochrysis_carterae.AAC.1